MTYLFFVYAVDIQTDIHINVLFLNLFYVKITLFNKDKMLEKVLKIKDFTRCFVVATLRTPRDAFAEINQPAGLSSIHSPSLDKV